MAKITVMDWRTIRATRVSVFGVVVFGGGRETLAPTDVRLRTIDYIQLTPMGHLAASGGIPTGSLSLKGSAAISVATSGKADIGILEGRGGNRGVGSSVTLAWVIGSSNTDTKLGSIGVGSKSAYFEAIGEL